MQRHITILDSTLRDGAQGEGISFSVEDKIGIVRALDELGIAYLEAGNPASNPKELEFFDRAAALPLKNATLVAFGSTCRKGCTPEEDANCLALLRANTPVVSIFGKCWELHVREILKTTPEENLRMIEETCRFFKEHGKTVIFDAEHFFDGYQASPDFALEVLRAAKRGGARILTLCDTNGGMIPCDIFAISTQICASFPDTEIGMHAHDDCGHGGCQFRLRHTGRRFPCAGHIPRVWGAHRQRKPFRCHPNATAQTWAFLHPGRTDAYADRDGYADCRNRKHHPA